MQPTFIAEKGASEPRKNLEAGMYVARCYQMVTLGTQEEEYLGKNKKTPKIWLGFEFPTELDTFVEERGPEPYTMGKEYSFYMNDKANLRKDLNTWRGVNLTDEQASTFDVGKLLGVPCTINVVAYVKKNGEPGVKIGSISPLMKGTTIPAQINPTQSFAVRQPDMALLEKLPKFLQDRIKKSPEYEEATMPKMNPVESRKPVPPGGNDFLTSDIGGEDDKEVPF